MSRLRFALATSAALGMGAACGYGGDATGSSEDGGVTLGDGGFTDAPSQADGSPDMPLGDAGILLTVTQLANVTQVSLSTEGTLGWIHWNFYGDYHRTISMAAAPNAIPTFSPLPATNDLAAFYDYTTAFQWDNGSSGGQYGNDRNGVYLKNPTPPSFHLVIAATTQGRRVVLYAGVFAATAQLTASLEGQVATPPALDSTTNGYIRYAIDFAAHAAGNLDIVWASTNNHGDGNSNITLAAATLAPAP